MTERVAPGDHFSTISAGYATFRPTYPRALFDTVVGLAPQRRVVWDCAAGTGQATLDLASYFDHVIATDVSAAQISQAPAHPNVEWRVAPAEDSGIASDSVDLITAAQALHWFDRPKFYTEAKRVAVDGAALVVWSYGSAELEGPLGEAYATFEHEAMGAYWPAERQVVLDMYTKIDLPFEPLELPAMRLRERWTRAQVLGYMRTWSATARYVKAHGTDPVIAFERELDALWPDSAETRAIEWPLAVRGGRIRKV